MKKYLNLVRMCAAVAAYVAVLAAVIWPAALIKRGWMAVTRTDMAERRRRNAAHVAASGAWLRHVMWLFMGMRVDVHLLHDKRGNMGARPYIYVSNHRSPIDGVFLPTVVKKTGDLDIRWVVKILVNWIPCIGTLMDGCGYAKVARGKDMAILGWILGALSAIGLRYSRRARTKISNETRRRFSRLVMARFYRLARDESASVGIFPEGERFAGQKPESNRSYVGDPSAGKASFRAMCERMPEHGVAVVTVLWPTLPGGKTIFDTADLCDRIVDVTVEFHPHVNPEDADRFLDDAFDEMDRAIARKMSRSPNPG